MRRIELIRIIGAAAHAQGHRWEFVREGADHEIWALNGHAIPIPRHREIRERLATAILRDAAEELGPRWWKR